VTAKIKGSLPKHNGLDSIADDMVANPHGKHIVVAVIDCVQIVTDTDTDESIPVARIRRIEVIQGDQVHMEHAAALLQAAADRRRGVDPLPFDMYVIADALLDEAQTTDEPPEDVES
jgi:hypothetical protein